ncbi:AfsR/SARP family transcriptional regulator [Streptosporangium amethystogenes]|uniref:AfsR/SARP family transcriptional regulator n=1 Tax=Streptosporangium amethystogenes TaxID=2002 RepID=UPI0004C7DF1A|nr:BTAD domain-containing putative transcriptional regulator [Streptosporangium amethystogenes]
MEIRVLGPVDVWRDGRSIAIVGPKQRTLMAVLVLQANKTVSHDQLLTALWGTKIPASGRRLLHNHLWSLRRLLTDGNAIVSTPTGYSLRLRPGASDLDVFVTETALARSVLSTGDATRASEGFRRALSLWRGPALGGTHSELQATEGAALEEQRLAALIGRVEADLTLGHHSELIGELRLLVTEHPLNEKLRGQLMLALHHTGRTAEALEEFRICRRHFRDELGLEPGEEVARIHQTILSGDSASGTAVVGQTPPALHVPRQLPADVSRFTGRVEKLRQLDMLLSEEEGTTTMVISAIAGTPGVGKTALATHWGHRVSARFPDGQLYINLHGYSRGRATTAGQALGRLLRGLGVVEDEIPHDLDERAALYRSLLSGRRMLIVLDNAATPDQVRPLLPGSSPSRVVITSRDALRGLSVTHDVQGISLDVLPAGEAIALLTNFLGGSEADVIAELARLCGYLPLALRLAAAQLAGGSPARIREFVGKLQQENRLTVLDLDEDPGIGVRTALEVSYRSLPAQARRVFRVLSLHPGPSIGLDAVAALSGLSPEDAAATVATLVNAHLLQEDSERRLSMHDLVRVYAEERCAVDEPADHRDDALTRTLDWYRHSVLKAMDHLSPVDTTSLAIAPVDGTPDFPGFDEAMAWLEREHHTLVAVIVHGARRDRHIHAWQTFSRLSWFFYARNHLDDLLMTGEIALSSARLIGDRSGEAEILSDLGYAKMFTGRYAENLSHQEEALEIWRTSGDRAREAKALRHVSYALHLAGHPARAIELGEQGLALNRSLGNRIDEFATMDTLAISYFTMGRFGEALKVLSECVSHWRETGREYDEAYCLIQLGLVHARLKEPATALDCLQQASHLGRNQGNQRIEVDALNGIATVLRQQDRYREALDHHEQALALARSLRSRPVEGEMLCSLAETCLTSGDTQAALDHYRDAARYADEETDAYQQGFAHEGLGNALRALGRTAEAAAHWKIAFGIFAPMGVPQADEIRKRMLAAGMS